jgi:hypothetical protein
MPAFGLSALPVTNIDLTLTVCGIPSLTATCWLGATGIWSVSIAPAPTQRQS